MNVVSVVLAAKSATRTLPVAMDLYARIAFAEQVVALILLVLVNMRASSTNARIRAPSLASVVNAPNVPSLIMESSVVARTAIRAIRKRVASSLCSAATRTASVTSLGYFVRRPVTVIPSALADKHAQTESVGLVAIQAAALPANSAREGRVSLVVGRTQTVRMTIRALMDSVLIHAFGTVPVERMRCAGCPITVHSAYVRTDITASHQWNVHHSSVRRTVTAILTNDAKVVPAKTHAWRSARVVLTHSVELLTGMPSVPAHRDMSGIRPWSVFR